MDPTRLPKIMINWKPEGRKKRGRPQRTWKDGIYTAMSERGYKIGRMEQPKAMEYGSWKASPDVLKLHIYICLHCLCVFSNETHNHLQDN
jgi:hypothetical protein